MLYLKRSFYKVSKVTLILSASILTCFSSNTQAETLYAAVMQAISTNPKVTAAKQNRLSVDQTIKQAEAGYLPHVKASVAYGPETSRNANTIEAVASGGHTTTVTMPVTQAGVTLDQMVFDGFATQGEVLRHTAQANSAAYQVLASIEDTAWITVQAYLDVLREMELVSIAKKNLDAHENILGMMRLRTKRGLSNTADFVQSEGRRALAESFLYAERNNLQDAIARYKFAVGEYPDHLIQPNLNINRYVPRNEKEAVDYASANNPIVKAAQSDIRMAYEQHEVAKAPNYPRLDLQAEYARNRNEGGVRGPDYDQFIYAKVSYDLFAGGAIVGRQRETEHLLNQAREIMYNASRQAREETRFAWNNLINSLNVLSYLKFHRDSTINTITAYRDQFKLTKRTLLDLLDVQNEHYNASKAYIEDEYKIMLAKFQLLHGMGKLSQAMHLPLPPETCLYNMC